MRDHCEAINDATSKPAPSITEGLFRVLGVPGELTIRAFSTANLARCVESFHPLREWSATDWATALGGECGELLNLIKKRRRGEVIDDQAIEDEAGDIVAYLDLLLAREGLDLARAVARKFNAVSERKGSRYRV